MVLFAHYCFQQIDDPLSCLQMANTRPLSGNNVAYIVLKSLVPTGVLPRQCKAYDCNYRIRLHQSFQ